MECKIDKNVGGVFKAQMFLTPSKQLFFARIFAKKIIFLSHSKPPFFGFL
jgi:hypothetical protein